MSSPYGTLVLVVAAAAVRGRDPVLPRLRAGLAARGLEHRVVVARVRGEAAALTRAAVEVDGGARFFVAVGGDVTVHEVVGGLVDPDGGPRREGLILGVVPAGSGSDFARTFGLDRTPERLVDHLAGEATFPLDVGRVELTDTHGGQARVCFANVAEVGFGAAIAGRAARLPGVLGRAGQLAAVFAALRSFRPADTRVVLDHTEAHAAYSNVVVANGQFAGGGMKVAPRALPDDGRFNVQLFRAAPREVFLLTPRMRRGEHLPDPQIQEYQSSGVEVLADAPLPVAVDGQLVGTTAARFDLLRHALALKI